MMTKEELEMFYNLSEKLAKEIKRVSLKLNEAYEGGSLKDKKEINVLDIAMNVRNKVNFRLSSHYIVDDLDEQRVIGIQELTIPNDKFNEKIDKEVAKMSKDRREHLIKEAEEKKLYLKLKEKYENKV